MDKTNLEMCLNEVLVHVDESLQYSIERISWVQEESFSRYYKITGDIEGLQEEIQEVICQHKHLETHWRRSRKKLLDASRKGNQKQQKDTYDEAEQLMFQKGRIEERERMLAQRRNDLQMEQRHLEKIMQNSKEMIEKMRVALELIHAERQKESGPEVIVQAEMIHSALRIFEREQSWVSRELHDGALQEMSASMLMADLAAKFFEKGRREEGLTEVRNIRGVLERTMGELRSLLWRFRPAGNEEKLVRGLQLIARQAENRYKISCTVEWEGPELNMPVERAANLFRIVQEALLNAIFKGEARNLLLKGSVSGQDGEPRVFSLAIQDDGKGFLVEEAREKARERGSCGLINMDERARIDGGTFSIKSAPGEGTLVSVTMPLQEE